MPRRYLDVESLDGVVVRCEVLEQDAGDYVPTDNWLHSLVIRPDTGAIVVVFFTRDTGIPMISAYDPHENRHEWDWPILAGRLERHTNRSTR